MLLSILDLSGDNKGSMDGSDGKNNKPLSWKTSKKRYASSTLGKRSSTRNIIKEVLERNKGSAKGRRMQIKYGIDIVELDTEDIDSEDSEIEWMSEFLSNSNDDFLESNIEKYTAPTQEKMKELRVPSARKGKWIFVQNPVSTITGKRRRSVDIDDKGPGPNSKSSKTSNSSETTGRGTSSAKKATPSKEKGLSQKSR